MYFVYYCCIVYFAVNIYFSYLTNTETYSLNLDLFYYYFFSIASLYIICSANVLSCYCLSWFSYFFS